MGASFWDMGPHVDCIPAIQMFFVFVDLIHLSSLGGGFKHFEFSPLLGEMIQFDEHIFQMGGSTTNQSVMYLLNLFYWCSIWSPKKPTMFTQLGFVISHMFYLLNKNRSEIPCVALSKALLGSLCGFFLWEHGSTNQVPWPFTTGCWTKNRGKTWENPPNHPF